MSEALIDRECLISIVIPTYNRADCIERAVFSALNQTYTNIEVIIVDDRSRDNTKEIIENIGDDRIKYFYAESKLGAARARNIGVQQASGELIAFLDSDDCWHPDKLRKQYELIRSDAECEMVFCKYKLSGIREGIFPDENSFVFDDKKKFAEFLLGRNRIGAPTVLVSKSAFINNGMFDESMRTLEDWEFAIRMALSTKILFINEVLVNAYSRSDGVNLIDGRKKLEAELSILKKYWGVFENKSQFFTLLSSIRATMNSLDEEQYQKYLNKLLTILCDKGTLLSIIVPVYNVEKYLSECLDSLITIPLKRIEFICINDGSTDCSLNILNKYADIDSRFKVISRNNSGYGKTVNVGIEIAKGKYVGIVESDDTINWKNYIEMLVVAFQYDLDLVKGSFDYYNDDTKEKTHYTGLDFFNQEEFLVKEDRNGEIFFLAPSIWSGLYKRTYIEENDIRFLNTPGASYQDTSFAFKVLACAEKFMIMNIPTINYRFNNSQSSSNHSQKVFQVTIEYQELVRFIEEKGLQHLYPYLVRARYLSYNWNAERLNLEDKIRFWRLTQNEFARDCDAGFFWRVHWSREEWHKINTLIFSFDTFVEKYILKAESIEKYIHYVSQMYLYGYDRNCYERISRLRQRGIEVKAIVDNNKCFSGNVYFEGIPVIDISQVPYSEIIVIQSDEVTEVTEVREDLIVVQEDHLCD